MKSQRCVFSFYGQLEGSLLNPRFCSTFSFSFFSLLCVLLVSPRYSARPSHFAPYKELSVREKYDGGKDLMACVCVGGDGVGMGG